MALETGLKDKVVLVMGATGDIGGACVRVFAQEDAKVVINGRKETKATELLQEIGENNGMIALGDVSNPDDIAAVFQSAVAKLGRVDVMVYASGISPFENTPAKDLKPDQWRTVIETNLLGAGIATTEFSKLVAEQGFGNIVYIGSAAGMGGEEGNIAYATSKSGMRAMMRTTAVEIAKLAPTGRANLVAPGWTITSMPPVQEFLSHQANVEGAFSTRSLAALAEAEDIAHAVVFLASDVLSPVTTGQAHEVDGGMYNRVVHRSPAEVAAAYQRMLEKHPEIAALVRKRESQAG